MLLREVESFLQTHKMAATKFGRLAAHDPRFVLDLRMGRTPRRETEERTLQWMQQFNAGTNPKHATRRFAADAILSKRAWPRLEVKGICHVA